MINFGKILESKLQEHNMTQAELGNLLGLNQRTISQYVRGNSQPSLETLAHICKILEIDIRYIFGTEKYDNSNMIIFEKDEIELLNCYRSLNINEKNIFNAFVYAITKSHNK